MRRLLRALARALSRGACGAYERERDRTGCVLIFRCLAARSFKAPSALHVWRGPPGGARSSLTAPTAPPARPQATCCALLASCEGRGWLCRLLFGEASSRPQATHAAAPLVSPTLSGSRDAPSSEAVAAAGGAAGAGRGSAGAWGYSSAGGGGAAAFEGAVEELVEALAGTALSQFAFIVTDHHAFLRDQDTLVSRYARSAIEQLWLLSGDRGLAAVEAGGEEGEANEEGLFGVDAPIGNLVAQLHTELSAANPVCNGPQFLSLGGGTRGGLRRA